MEKIDKGKDTVQIEVSKEVYNHLYHIVNLFRTANCSNGEHRPYSRAIKHVFVRAGLWNGRDRMNTSYNVFYCYALGRNFPINNHFCNECSCPYASQCLLMKPLFD